MLLHLGNANFFYTVLLFLLFLQSNAVLGCNLKNDRMISVRFQGRPFSITVIQLYAPTTNVKEVEVEGFYEDPQDLELTPKERCPFHYRELE